MQDIIEIKISVNIDRKTLLSETSVYIEID